SIVLSAKGTASRTSSGSSSRANALPSPVSAIASATWFSAKRFGEQASRRRSGANLIARKMGESDIDAALEVNLCSERESDWTRQLARSFGSAVTTLICAVLAYASFDMVLLDKGRVDTLAGGVPEWWFEVVMPIGFAVMSVRGAMKAPTRGSRIFCFVIIAAVLPFV